MKSNLPQILAFCLLPGLALSQGVPTNDSGLTSRDIVETGDREADLAVQADKLSVRELIAEIEREQLATLQRILDAQTSFGGQGLPAMVSGLESGSGDPERAVEAVYGTGEIDPNPGGAQMFGDASETIEQLILLKDKESVAESKEEADIIRSQIEFTEAIISLANQNLILNITETNANN